VEYAKAQRMWPNIWMRWTIAASALLHMALIIAVGVFMRPPPNQNSIRANPSMMRSEPQRQYDVIEFDFMVSPKAVKRTAESKPETALSRKPMKDRAAKVEPPKPSFKLQRLEGNYQITISPSFTGTNQVKEPASAEDAKESGQ